MSFEVEQKVICVRDGGKLPLLYRISIWWYGVVRCRKGFIGTVCNIYLAPDGEEMIELTELPSPEAGPWMAGFKARCFRPLVKRETDISVFKAMLTDSKVTA